jgi:hypothetical protein
LKNIDVRGLELWEIRALIVVSFCGNGAIIQTRMLPEAQPMEYLTNARKVGISNN